MKTLLPLGLIFLLTISMVFADDSSTSSSDTSSKTKKRNTGFEPIIGIDLGTSNRVTPSYVSFIPNSGERLVGHTAKKQLFTNPHNTIFDTKRLIGRAFNDTTVQDDLKLWPFEVINKNNTPRVQVKVGSETKHFAPEEISAMVLSKMKETAESYLGEEFISAVVTVPAYFNDTQRQATREAGSIAGLRIVRIISEPVAAAMAYGLDQKEGDQNVLVFHLGGGTFDVTLLTIDNGVFEVWAKNGDSYLGGEDFDQRIMEYLFKLYKSKTGKDLSLDPRAMQKLRSEVEKAKRALSVQLEVKVEVESLIDGEDFSETLTRAKFEELNMDLFRAMLKSVEKVLEDGELKKEDVHEIVLTGGSSHIPKVHQLLKEFFNGKEPYGGINPDEVVTHGAAIQGGIIRRGEECGCDYPIHDVNPLTLGIETVGGVMAKLITRHTVIPTRKSQIFSTAADNQTSVIIQIFEGERPLTRHNHQLGKFELTGISPAPRGVPQIEVTFEIDVNNILHVTAEDKSTGNRNKITITSDYNRLSPEDIERMFDDAEKYADEDNKIKEVTDARNELEGNVAVVGQLYAVQAPTTGAGLEGNADEKDEL